MITVINAVRARYLRHVAAGRIHIHSIDGQRARPTLMPLARPENHWDSIPRPAAHHISELEGAGLVMRLPDIARMRLTVAGREALATYDAEHPE